MGKINMQKVIIGGLIAGLVLNVVDYTLYGVILADRLATVMAELNRPPIGGSSIILFIALDFVWGIVAVYTYAAIRPRFGPGPGTAVRAGLLLWFVAGLLHAVGESPFGIFPTDLIVIGVAVFLVLLPLATAIGARFYQEEQAA
jgi:hypothetical protein